MIEFCGYLTTSVLVVRTGGHRDAVPRLLQHGDTFLVPTGDPPLSQDGSFYYRYEIVTPVQVEEPPECRPPSPGYEYIGPYGVNSYAPHRHEGREHAHDGGADPHAHPLYPGDNR